MPSTNCVFPENRLPQTDIEKYYQKSIHIVELGKMAQVMYQELMDDCLCTASDPMLPFEPQIMDTQMSKEEMEWAKTVVIFGQKIHNSYLVPRPEGVYEITSDLGARDRRARRARRLRIDDGEEASGGGLQNARKYTNSTKKRQNREFQ